MVVVAGRVVEGKGTSASLAIVVVVVVVVAGPAARSLQYELLEERWSTGR
jgi:hypothetical protein